jgi:hypothetical protein
MNRWLGLAAAALVAAFLLPAPAHAQTAGWLFPTGSSLSLTNANNGQIVASDDAPGASLTVNLPSSGISAGWLVGFSEGAGRGFTINAPGGAYILSGQKTLTSFAAPSDTNYEYFAVSYDGANFRLLTSTQATSLYNGIIGAPGGSSWTYLFSSGYAATPVDNGHIFSSAFAGAATTVTLPSTPLVPNGWAVSYYAATNSITLKTNSVSGGSIITPGGLSNSSYMVAAGSFVIVSFDGAAFRLLTVTKPANSISLVSYGGNGGGSVDNLSALALADAAGAAAGGAMIVIPAGSYYVSAQPAFSAVNQWVFLPGALLTGPGSLAAQTPMLGGYISGPSTFNPYAYNTYTAAAPLSQNVLYAPNGSLTVNNPVPHGMLSSGGAAVFSAGGNLDTNTDVSECYAGWPDYPTLAQNWNVFGGVAVCEIFNAKAPLNMAGTFSATAFFPTVPFSPALLPGGLPLQDVIIASDDLPIPYGGMSSHTVLNGSGLVTEIDVPGWYQPGAASPGTPTGHTAFINWGGDQFARNTKSLLTSLNGMTVSTVSGSPNVTLAGTDISFVSIYQFIGDGGLAIPANAVVTDFTPSTGVAVIDPPATATMAAHTATISTQPFNLGQVAEEDARNHSGFDFDPTIYPESGTITTGSNIVTAVSDIADLRIGMNCAGAGFSGSTILWIDRGADNIYTSVHYAASGAKTFNCFWGYQTGNAGIVVSAQNNINPSAFNARGQSAFGFIVQGAADTAYLVGRQTGSDAHPKWGFRSDRTFTGASQCDFAITTGEKAAIDGNTIWCADQFEEFFNTSGMPLPVPTVSGIVAQWASPNATLLNPVSYGGNASYLLPTASGGTASAPTALASGAIIGGIQAGGYDGSVWNYSAGDIQLATASAWSTSSHATDIQFMVVPNGVTTSIKPFAMEQDRTLVSFRPAGSPPTVSSGSSACGVSPSVVGSVMAGLISVGTGTVGSSCTVAWPTATEFAPHCLLSDRTTATAIRMTAADTNGFTFAGSFAASNQIDYVCSFTN